MRICKSKADVFIPSVLIKRSEMLDQRQGIENVLKNENSGGLLI
jgi:hypothetical protein